MPPSRPQPSRFAALFNLIELGAFSKARILGAIFLLSLILHAPFVNLPPRGVHAWRQCNTLAVARNFYQEDMNIFRPRVDRRLTTNGVTGMQFPSYEFAVALGYQALGEHPWVHRVISLAILFAGTAAFYDLLLAVFGSALAAALGAWLFCFSPDLFYFGFSALPDVLALAASIAALAAFVRWYRGESWVFFVLSLAGATLAGLTKLQFLAIGFPILVYVLLHQDQARSWGKRGWLALYAVVAVSLSLGWYRWALHLIEASGLRDFGIRFHGADQWQAGLKIILHNLVSDIPELILGYPSALLFCLGLAALLKAGSRLGPWRWPISTWALAIGTYYLIELGQMKDHSYYLMPLLPLLLVVCVLGGLELWRRGMAGWLLALVLILPLSTSLRILPRWMGTDRGLPLEFQDPAALARLSAASDSRSLALVGPDESGCIYLYYLRKKGFGFNTKEDLASGIATAVSQGASVLYCDDPEALKLQPVQPYLKSLRLQEGRFQVWDLRPSPRLLY